MEWDRLSTRRAVIWTAWAVVLLAGLAGIFVWHSIRSYEVALGEFEAHVGSANHRDYLRGPVPDEQNAVLVFRDAAARIEMGREWVGTLEPVAWSVATEAAAREVLDRNRQAIDDLRAAAELPSCVWQSKPLEAEDSPLEVLQAARLLRLLGFVGIVDGDRDRIESSFRVLGGLAECLYSQPYLVGSLIALSVERTQLEVVRAAVSSPSIGTGLLEFLKTELARLSKIDRVRWAVAAEGAFALTLLEDGNADLVPLSGGPLRSVFSKRVATALALRWAEFAVWTERPFEELLAASTPSPEIGLALGGFLADMAIANLRHHVVNLRTNRALIGLALVAVEGVLYGRRHGGYDDAFDEESGLDVLSEGDGTAVLIDAKLESLLHAYLISTAESGTSIAESTLDLTVWRLPRPSAPQPRRSP